MKVFTEIVGLSGVDQIDQPAVIATVEIHDGANVAAFTLTKADGKTVTMYLGHHQALAILGAVGACAYNM